MKQIPVHKIDGRILYYSFLAGARHVLRSQAEINKINVFPVNDKDTGTNLASTVRSVMDNLRPDRSFSVTAGSIAEAALTGARGNSGVIFAQFLYGLSMEAENRHELTFREFADMVHRSVRYLYDAVAEPVEGTMLTIIREWAAYLKSRQEELVDFKRALLDSLEILNKALQETREKLLVLKKYNLVDAGAKGFVVFVEGILEMIRTANFRSLVRDVPQAILFDHEEEENAGEIAFRYCTEAMIGDVSLDHHTLQELLRKYGDSVVVAGAARATRIHVHTNNPADLFYELKDFGTISSQKVEDMVMQNESVSNRKWNIALVTDSTCDLPQEILDHYQVTVVPLNLHFGENHYLDKVTITPRQFYQLLDGSRHFPKTSQINERSFTNVFARLATHYDAIIALHLSGQFSGTLASSQKAAERVSQEFSKPVHVIDSKCLSGALGLIVLRTAQAIERGDALESIVQSMDEWIRNTHILVSVKTLKYFIRGGRVSKPKGLISSLLNIKPIVSVDRQGKSVLMGKSFGYASGMKLVLKKIRQMHENQPVWNYIVLHAHNPEGAEEYVQKLKVLTGKEPAAVVDISPAIGMHAGIGATAVSFMLT